MRAFCAAAATNAAKDRGAETGTQFVVDVVIEADDGVRVIRADGVPFGKKNLSGKNLKNNGGFQFQPIWHRTSEGKSSAQQNLKSSPSRCPITGICASRKS